MLAAINEIPTAEGGGGRYNLFQWSKDNLVLTEKLIKIFNCFKLFNGLLNDSVSA
jgi:hypothetical protein